MELVSDGTWRCYYRTPKAIEEGIDVRFERLLALLTAEHCVLGALAGQAGFPSENILQRAFKARYGMTLSAYRKKHTPGRITRPPN